MTPLVRKYLIFGVLTIVSLVADQWTKIWARAVLKPLIGSAERTKIVVQGFFDLQYSENTGVAFGMLQNMPGGAWILTAVAIGAFVLVLYYLHKTELSQTRMHAALGLVAGGAMGNLIDRILYKKVTDFILWHYRDAFRWPNFNIADAALVIGVGLMALDMFKAGAKPGTKLAAPPAERP